MEKETQLGDGQSSYMVALDDGRFMIGCLATYDSGTVILNKAELRALFGELRRLDNEGLLED